MFKGLTNKAKDGAHKIAKQLSKSVISEVSAEEADVLEYLAFHEDQPISMAGIARGSDMTPYKAGKIIRKLVEEKVIVKSNPKRGQGTRYWILRGPNSESKARIRLSFRIRR